MLGLRDAYWYEWDEKTHELRQRVSPDGEILLTVPGVPDEATASQMVDDYLADKEQARVDLRAAAKQAITTNEQQMSDNMDMWRAADAFMADLTIQNYNLAADPLVALRDLLSGLKLLDRKTKEIAGAVQILLVHDQTTKEQLNRLIKLVIGDV